MKSKRNPLLDPVFFPKQGFAASEKLRALCVGTKMVKCRWPHRELHDAAAIMDRLIAAVIALRSVSKAAEYARENKLPLPNCGFVFAELRKIADDLHPIKDT